MPAYRCLFVRNRLTGLLLMLVSVFWGGCATGRAVMVTGPELMDRINSGNPPAIVDARSAGEYESGHVPGAVNIPFWAVLSRHDQISSAPDQPIVVYCEHGPRAVMAKFAFRLVGFQEVLYLDGDLTSWKAAKLPMETSPVTP